ncbi:MAG: isochorismatase family protein [Chloroflexota bacterium]|nr:isochorismatase family protein [Chloroflexota bacterium]
MSLAERSTRYLDYLEDWLDALPVLLLERAIPDPERTAIISVDVINAFLYEGPLSSPRVAAIDKPITHLMMAAWNLGMHDILLLQDAHQEDSLEFDAFGAHALKGTPGAEAIDKIKTLPFYNRVETIYKDSISLAFNNTFRDWLDQREYLKTLIVIGDVTDLCVYHLATYLRFSANAYHKNWRIILPANCVQTWHLSVEGAEQIPAMPHHGDLLHAIFLHHIAINGIEVVKEIKI